jgi:hypothetical protein
VEGLEDFNYLYGMKKCKKCEETLVIGCNISQNTFNRSDYICKSCSNTLRKNNSWRLGLKGVYGIFENQECLYVGESKQIRRRISDHKNGIKNPKNKLQSPLWINLGQYSNLEFKIIEETPNHKEREQYWINKLKPKYNT